MEDLAFEEIFEEVSWELCMEAASMATTVLSIDVYTDIEKPDILKRAKSLDEGVEELRRTEGGGLKITGNWKAGGKRGDLEIVYAKLLSPTATHGFIVRYLNESIQLDIAKQLMRMKNPNVESSGPPDE